MQWFMDARKAETKNMERFIHTSPLEKWYILQNVRGIMFSQSSEISEALEAIALIL